jgi:hypothetical protein
VLPVWNDVLRGQMLDLNDRVRRSNYSYNITGRTFRVYPQPSGGIKLFFEYYLDHDPFLAEALSDAEQASVSGMSNLSNIPLSNIAYDAINATGKRWIRQFTLALSTELLGMIRAKFGSIPIPGADIILNGPQLVSEGREKQAALKQELETLLERLLNVNMMKEQAEVAKALEQQYESVPLGVYRLA